MWAEEIAARYKHPGKRQARQLVVDIAVADKCVSALDFWGGGESARLLTDAGIQVVSAEINRDWYEAMDADAARHGYNPHHGLASNVQRKFDMIFADFCGGASPETLRELRKLAGMAERWLAVTLAPDHQLDRTLQGPMADFTLPSWLIGATGFSLELVRRYVRNDFGQTMWFALMRPSVRRGYVINPMTIADALRGRYRQWISVAMLDEYGALVRKGFCRYCGEPTIGIRRDLVYCSNRCRWNAAYPKKARYQAAHGLRACARCGRVIADRVPKQRYHVECALENRRTADRKRRSQVDPRRSRWLEAA